MLMCSESLWKDPEDARNSVALEGDKAGQATGSGRETFTLPASFIRCYFLFVFLEYSLNFKELCILNKAGTLGQASSPTWVGLAPAGEPCQGQDASKPPRALGQTQSWGPLA